MFVRHSSSVQRTGIARMAATSGAFALGLATLIAQAAPAAADDQQFLHELEGRYAFMTPQQLLAAGHRACAVMASGKPAADASDVIDHQWGLGPSVAFDVTRNASNHLGC